jgi:hypothetical protein
VRHQTRQCSRYYPRQLLLSRCIRLLRSSGETQNCLCVLSYFGLDRRRAQNPLHLITTSPTDYSPPLDPSPWSAICGATISSLAAKFSSSELSTPKHRSGTHAPILATISSHTLITRLTPSFCFGSRISSGRNAPPRSYKDPNYPVLTGRRNMSQIFTYPKPEKPLDCETINPRPLHPLTPPKANLSRGAPTLPLEAARRTIGENAARIIPGYILSTHVRQPLTGMSSADAEMIYRYFKQQGRERNATLDPLPNSQQLLLLVNRILQLLAKL